MEFFWGIYIKLFNSLTSSNLTTLGILGFCVIGFFYFYLVATGFFKVIFAILITVGFSILISHFGGDFYSGLLLTAEFPVFFILILFYFHKYSINFDSLYSVKLSIKPIYALYTIFALFCLHIFWGTSYLFTTMQFNYYYLLDLYSIASLRNDFLTLFLVYYILNSGLVILVGIIIFLVSYLVIVLYIINKKLVYSKKKDSKNIMFLRKQNLLKQGVYKSTLRFYKKKM